MRSVAIRSFAVLFSCIVTLLLSSIGMAQPANSGWPVIRGDLYGTMRSTGMYTLPKIKWQTGTFTENKYSFIGTNGRAYRLAEGLSCLDIRTGSILYDDQSWHTGATWQFGLNDQFADRNGNFFFLVQDPSSSNPQYLLVCFDGLKDKVRWSVPATYLDGITLDPLGHVLQFNQQGTTAYNPMDGSVVWINSAIKGVGWPTVTGQMLGASAAGPGNVVTFDPASGAISGSFKIAGPGGLNGFGALLSDNNFYGGVVINGFPALAGFSAVDGSFLGSMFADIFGKFEGAVSMAGVSFAQDGTMIALGNDGNIRGFDFASKTVKWTFSAPDQDANTALSEACISADNVAFIVNQSGYVYALNASTGALIWKCALPNISPSAIKDSPAPILASDGTLIVGDYALDSIHVISISLNPTSLVGGHNSSGTVTINYPAPTGGLTVALSSDQVAAGVPSVITVPAGQTSATFTVNTTAVSTKTIATITAMPGIDQTATLTIQPAPVSTLSFSPSSVVGGNTRIGTVTLTDPAGPKGVSVSLTSDSSFAQVPATMTVAAGQTSGTFTVTTSGVDSSSTANISAASGGVTVTTPLTVTPPGVQSVTLNPTSISGGSTSTGTVTLNGQAGPSGVSVALASDSSAATVPSTVTVAAGKSSATFTVSTTGVDSQTTANISASLNSTTQSAPLTIGVAKISSLTLSPTTVRGGTSSTGTITLNGLAGPSGVVVNLSSDNSAATVPITVSIPAGKVSATFTVSTSGVDSQTVATLTAGLGGTNLTAKLTITPTSLSSISLNPTSVLGGNSSTGTITLTGPAGPSGAVVNLTSSSQTVASVPGTVTVTSGSTTATFTVNTSGVDAQTNVAISGTFASSTQSATLTVTPANLTSLSLNPSSVVAGGSSTGTVTLDGKAGPSGKTVSLKSSSPSAMVPASVVIPAGGTSATFNVSTSGVDSQTSATITGTAGSVSQTGTLVIQPATISSLALNPTTVAGGSPSTGTVTLNGPAGPSGLLATLASDNAAATVPASVTVSSSRTSATFTVTTNGVNTQSTANITGTTGAVSKSAALTITASTLTSLTLSPISVIGGGTSTGTVTLSGPAASGGSVVSLSSDNSAATIPATVTVASGAISATFTVTTTGVSTQTTANINGSLNGSSQSAALTVSPATLSSLTLTPTTVAGGNSFTGLVSLSGSAGPSGVTVTLSSSSSVVSIPVSVTIPAGSSSASFNGTTSVVTSQVQATITAKWGSSTLTAIETVTPPSLVGITVNPSSVSGGNSSAGTVGLNGPAPKGGVTVKLTSSDKSVIVPATVLISAGNQTGNFVAKTTAVATVKTVTLTASFNGVSVTTTLTVNPPELTNLTLNPTSVVGGTNSTGTVSISGPAPSTGIVVKLSSNIGAATVPASIIIPSGKVSATFIVKTLAVGSNTQATISASLNGSSLTATLTIKAPVLSTITVSPSTVTGGKTATGTVTISSPAPLGGLSIQIGSDQQAASVPGSVTIPSGKASVTFTVRTVKVSTKTVANISGSLNGVTKSTKLTIQ